MNNFKYNPTPLSQLEIKAVELTAYGKTPEEIATELSVPIERVRKWKTRVLFRCELNLTINERREAGINHHEMMLSMPIDASQARASVSVLKELKATTPKPTTPQAIMEADYIKSLTEEERIIVGMAGGVPEAIKSAIQKAILEGEESLE